MLYGVSSESLGGGALLVSSTPHPQHLVQRPTQSRPFVGQVIDKRPDMPYSLNVGLVASNGIHLSSRSFSIASQVWYITEVSILVHKGTDRRYFRLHGPYSLCCN